VTALLVVAVAVLPLLVAATLLELDRYRFEPVPGLVMCLAWGAIAAGLWTFLVRPLFLERAARLPGGSWPPLAAMLAVAVLLAVVEAVPLVLLGLASRLLGPVEWLTHALAIGAGLSLVVALPAALGPSPGSPPAVLALAATPVLGSALIGLGLGFLVAARGWVLRAYGLVLLAITPATQLTVFRAGLGGATAGPHAREWVLVASSLLLLASAMAGAWWLESRILEAELAEEAEHGVLPARVAAGAAVLRRRIRSDWWARRDERRALNLLLATLAFRKHALRGLGPERARIYSLEVGRLRERARRILGGVQPSP
jgi:hypothetical protein